MPPSQIRNLTCISSLGAEANFSSCPYPPPATNRTCQEQDCSSSGPQGFDLVMGPWSACDAACGASNRSRGVVCQSREGYLAELSSCRDGPTGVWRGRLVLCVCVCVLLFGFETP